MDDLAPIPPEAQPPTPEAARFLAALRLMQHNASPAPAGGGLPPEAQAYLDRSVANVGLAPQAGSPQPIATPGTGMIAPVAGPADNPSVTSPLSPHQVRPGPIKSLLSNLLYGAGQSLVHRAGLPTDLEKQTLVQNQAIKQQGANDLSAQRQASTDLVTGRSAQLDQMTAPVQVPNNPAFGAAAGQTVTHAEFTGILKTLALGQNAANVQSLKGENALDLQGAKGQNALDVTKAKYGEQGALTHGFKDIGGRAVMYDKRTGAILQDMGESNALVAGPATANARAEAYARYGGAQVMDENGNPTTVSRLTQLQTGAPTITEKTSQGLAGDKLGAATYLAANKAVEDNLSILRDTTQRGIIARATEDVERNPGAIDSIISSALQSGLSPQGAKLIAAMKQMNEFGSTFKKYTGNGGSSTDSLRATIHSNQPSTANSDAVNLNLLRQDRALAAGVLQNLNRPGTYTVPARGSSVPAAAPTSTYHPGFHPLQ